MKEAEKRRVALVWIFLAIVIFLSFYFDSEIVKTVSLIRNDTLTDFLMGITFVSSILILFLFLTLLFVKENKRKWVLPLWLSLVLSIGLTLVVLFLLLMAWQKQAI